MEGTSSSTPSPSFPNYSVSNILLQIKMELDQFRDQYAEQLPDICKIFNIGEDYKRFKPIRRNSLFYRIVHDPCNFQELAQNWVSNWKSTPEQATIAMLQLFVDVACFRNYNVEEKYIKGDYDRMLADMLEDVPAIIYDYGYLLEKRATWVKQTIGVLSAFVRAVVFSSETKLVLWEDIFLEIFGFLNAMCRHSVRAFKHTGVVFAIMFCIPLAEIAYDHAYVYSRLLGVVQHSREYEEQLSDKMERYQVQYDVCVHYTKFLANCILNECARRDPELEELHKFCASKIGLLYITLKEPVYRHKMLTVLIDYANYFQSDQTKIFSIRTFVSLFKNRNFEIGNFDHSRIIAVLYDHTLHVNLAVAVEAFQALTAAVTLYPQWFKEDLLNKIFLYLYNKFYVLGKEAGYFFMAYLRHSGNSAKEIYMELARFQASCGTRFVDLFVESIFEATPELGDPEVAFNLLFDKGLQFSEEIALLEILGHAMFRMLVGKPQDAREDSALAKADSLRIERVLNQTIPKLPRLFEKYINEEKCVKSLLMIIKSLPYEDHAAMRYQADLNDTLKLCTKLFFITKDEEILLSIAETLKSSSSEQSRVRTHSVAIIKHIVEKCVNDYQAHNSRLEGNEDNECIVNASLARLAALSKFFGLPDFEDISPLFNPELRHEETVFNHFKYEHGILIQKLETYIGNKNSEDIENLKKSYLSFVNECCNFLSTSSLRKKKKYLLECVLDLCFFKNKNKLICNAFPDLTDNQLMTVCKYIKLQFLEKDAASAKLLEKIFTSFHFISPNIMVFTWAFYNKLYSSYGGLFDDCLKKMFRVAQTTTTVFIFKVIATEYEGLLKNGITACDTSKDLEKLAVQFSYRMVRSELFKLTNALINFAEQNDQFLGILDYAKYFCSGLSQSQMRTLSAKMCRVFAGPKLSHEKLLHFLAYLKRRLEHG